MSFDKDSNFYPSQMFSYYPKYEFLDNVVTKTGKRNINIYVDVKGCGQALFQEWAVKHILFNSEGSSTVDTSIFSSIVEFVSFHKKYAKKRNLNLKMYFFMESGESIYHTKIYSDYKKNRGSDDFFGLDLSKKEVFKKILDKNYKVTESVLNKLPNVYFIRLDFMEADFIPWYLMKIALPKEEVQNSLNVIYSMDKDMLQCLYDDNIFQFFKHYKNIKMISSNDIYDHWIHVDIPTNDPSDWFPLALAIIGDPGDGFLGVSGIGGKTFGKLFEYIKTLCNRSMDSVYDQIKNNQPIFNKKYNPANKALQKIINNEELIIRNLKLASYKLLTDYLMGDYPTEIINKRNKINEVLLNEKKFHNPNVLHTAIQKNGLMGIIHEQTILSLF